MKIQKSRSISLFIMVAVMIAMVTGVAFATANQPMTPEVAAKRENFRKQNEQRVTDVQRKTAAEGLKAERLKVYQAKQLLNKSKTEKNNIK